MRFSLSSLLRARTQVCTTFGLASQSLSTAWTWRSGRCCQSHPPPCFRQHYTASSFLFSPLQRELIARGRCSLQYLYVGAGRNVTQPEDVKASHMSFMRHTGALPRELCPQLPHHDISKGHRSHRHDGRFPLLSNAFLGPPKRFRSGRDHVMPQWPWPWPWPSPH